MEHKRVDMMMCSTNQKIYQYDVKIFNVVGDFNMAATVSKVDRSVLLTIPNPRYADKIRQYPHLQGVFINDEKQAVNQKTGNKAMPKNNLDTNLEKPRATMEQNRGHHHHRRLIPKGLPRSI